MSVVPIDLVSVIEKGVRDEQRPYDGLLHASGDLVGSLRHSQLGFVGAPTLPRHLVEDIRLRTGTMWHEYIGSLLTAAGVPYMAEVALAPWMPTGWSGTADLIFWHPEYEGWVLVDIKTMKGEGLQWVEKDGMKEEHLWQASAYWHALVNAGFPMVDKFGILYLPMNMVYGESMPNPSVQEGTPIPEDTIIPLMQERYEACLAFREAVDVDIIQKGHYGWPDEAMELLAPVQDRVQKLFWAGKTKPNQWDVKLVPHWSAQFCPYPNELCDCSEGKVEKIGHWTAGEKNASGKIIPGADGSTLTYTPRKGYDIEPEVMPTAGEVKRRTK
jgi:hypothetical protein